MKNLIVAQELDNILVVDDTPQSLHLLSDILTKYKYKVRPVPNGKLALSAVEINQPDLIILDIMMPGLDGYQVCKQLKSNPKTKDIPVIFVSAVDEPVDKVRAFALGAVDYITKPFQMHEVLMRVKNQLTVVTLNQKLQAKNEQLSQTISQLKKNQKQLVKSERYLFIEKIFSGITKQVNEPLLDMQSSLSELYKSQESSLEKLPTFLQQISHEQQKYFAVLLKQVQEHKTSLSAIEKQKLKAQIIAKLNPFQLREANKVADILLELGFNEEIDSFLPLLTGKNYLEILENARLVSNLHQNIQTIADSKSKLTKIVDAFKNYSSSAKNDHQNRPSNLESTVEMALSLLTKQINSDIKIIKNYDNVSTISCNYEKITKVWLHLIKNALDAMGDQGILTINISHQQDNIAIEVKDTGSGIAPKLINRIYDPFFSTKSLKEHTGCGLMIAKQIIEQHEGTIAVKSVPGDTTFTVYLPLN